jgi:phage head maturation protease
LVDTAATESLEDVLRSIEVEAPIQVRDAAKRELDVRLVPWDRVIPTLHGLETFARGAFDGTDISKVRLYGLEHEVHLGLGQNGQPKLTRHPVGKAIALEDREDGAYATFRVAQTSRGDEVLALAADDIASGVSVEIIEVPGGTAVETRSGRRTRVHRRVLLTGASTTYQPAYGMDPQGSVVLAVRTAEETPVAETPAVAEAPAPVQISDLKTFGETLGEQIKGAIVETRAQSAISDEVMQKFLDRLEALEERTRSSIEIPSKPEGSHPEDFGKGDWLKLVLRTLTGESVNQAELQARVVADLITADNLGVVPPAYLNEMIGIIDPSRPFLQSTRKLTTPRSGMQLTVPKIVTRPTTGVQAEEKDELASTATSIVPVNYNPVTIGGYGDISIQLLKRSDPSYLELYLDLLFEAYAIDADDEAVDALLDEAAVVEGGAIDPDDGPTFGAAWANAAAISRRLTPDTIWLSSAAAAAFIDAKATTSNAPLYGNLNGGFSAAGGVGGTISGLRPVHVPALDDEAVDLIVGPSRGFAWAEDGTYTLQVDVPAKAGRDVGIVGMLWFAPLYPAAFTSYTIAS